MEYKSKKQNQEDSKEKQKQTLKVAVISSICTLLFIIILLLLILLGLRNCVKTNNNSDSSSNEQSSSQKYDYDNTKIDDVFKKLVFNQVYVDMGTEDPIDKIIAVTYNDSDSHFTINIDAKIGDNIYFYSANNITYSGHDNFVSYLLTLNLDNNLPLIEGDTYGVSLLPISNERLVNEKSTSYVITNGASSKYLSGYYFENNQYYVYQKIELNNNDAFPLAASKIIDIDSPLYRYYQMLNS